MRMNKEQLLLLAEGIHCTTVLTPGREIRLTSGFQPNAFKAFVGRAAKDAAVSWRTQSNAYADGGCSLELLDRIKFDLGAGPLPQLQLRAGRWVDDP